MAKKTTFPEPRHHDALWPRTVGLHQLYARPLVQIGTVGVDAGMLYVGDPCYVIDAPLGRRAWDQFLKEIAGPEGYLESHAVVEGESVTGNRFPAGLVCVSGAGDGEYPVYAEMTADGLIARLVIDFKL